MLGVCYEVYISGFRFTNEDLGQVGLLPLEEARLLGHRSWVYRVRPMTSATTPWRVRLNLQTSVVT